MSTTIILADDHAIMREGLRALLESESDLKIVGEAENGRAAVELANRFCPDLVVMDIGMPDLNGIEAARQIKANNPSIKIIALSSYAEKQFVLAMLEAGAVAYVLKSSASDELLRAIRTVLKDQVYLCSPIAGVVVEGYLNQNGASKGTPVTLLTSREREVLQLLAEGKTSKQIGSTLEISDSTVEVHRRNIMKKLNLNTVAELTKYAIREGLTSL